MLYNSFRKARPALPETRKEPPPPKPKFGVLAPAGDSKAQKDPSILLPSGPYHLNHFICYFKIKDRTFTDAQGANTAQILTLHFFKNFCQIFSENNIARAQYGHNGYDLFEESKVIEFTLGSNLGSVEHRAMGFLHTDWVAMSTVPKAPFSKIEDRSVSKIQSFYGETLVRYWDTEVEKALITGIFALKSGIDSIEKPLKFLKNTRAYLLMNKMIAEHKIRFNRQHFLAGTRSWRVGYDSSSNHFFIETVTIERYSCNFYEEANKKHDTRDDVLALWDNLLNNFINTKSIRDYRFTPVAPPAEMAMDRRYRISPILNEIRHYTWQGSFALLEYEERRPAWEPTMPIIKTIEERHVGLHAHLPSRQVKK